MRINIFNSYDKDYSYIKLLTSEPSLGSDENLQNDRYLISLMDEQGWVPISTVAGFKRVCPKHILPPNCVIILWVYVIWSCIFCKT